MIGLWREKVAEIGIAESARVVDKAGLSVSSLCRGGFFASERSQAENRSAVEEAAALGAPVLVLVCGGLPAGSRDLEAARRTVAEGLDTLAGYAAGRGVRLGIEPLHPMFCADRSVVCTLAQALELAAPYPPELVGVVVDAYHVWWDPDLEAGIAAARGRIAGFHVDDWVLPLPEGALLGRGLPGDGCIDLDRLAAAVGAAGYDGPVEVEVLNEEIWSRRPDEVLGAVVAHMAAAQTRRERWDERPV